MNLFTTETQRAQRALNSNNDLVEFMSRKEQRSRGAENQEQGTSDK